MSLASQRLHGIDLRGSAGREVASQQDDEHHDSSGGCEDADLKATHTKEYALNGTAGRDSANKAQCQANQKQFCAGTKNACKNLSR